MIDEYTIVHILVAIVVASGVAYVVNLLLDPEG